jgi:hypothetical protein
LQAAESVKFAQSQVAEQLAADVQPNAIGRGIAEQIALACRISPVMAARGWIWRGALWFELPDTYSQLSAPGYGQLPGGLAREINATSKGRKWWRRLFTGPNSQADR